MAEKSLREKLRSGVETFDKSIQDKVQKVKKNVKAGAEFSGAVLKTIGKRVVGDDSPTDLSAETKNTLNIKE